MDNGKTQRQTARERIARQRAAEQQRRRRLLLAGGSGLLVLAIVGTFIGSQYQPTAFSGLTWSQVAAAIRNPSTAIAKQVNGAANQITSELCRLTHGKPGSVCTASGVTAAAAR